MYKLTILIIVLFFNVVVYADGGEHHGHGGYGGGWEGHRGGWGGHHGGYGRQLYYPYPSYPQYPIIQQPYYPQQYYGYGQQFGIIAPGVSIFFGN